MWQVTQLDKIGEDSGPLNDVELQCIRHCPALHRIPTAQKPVMLQGYVPKNHNPDFLLLNSIFVELKGHVRDSMYRPMLAHFPDWIKRRYHVLICNTSRKERDKMVLFCTKNNISWSIGPEVPGWLVLRAMELGPMQNDSSILWLP